MDAAARLGDHPYRQAFPDQLAVAALAHGLEPPPPGRARVLELGCGAGGTLLAVACAAPGAAVVGADASAAAVAVARERAADAGLANVAVRRAALPELADGELGAFDYVVAHGVYSWVDPGARDRLVAAVAAHLAPGGIGYLSHAALPGGHLLAVLRRAALWHAGTGPDRAARARELFTDLLARRATDAEGDWYGRFLRYELPPLLAQPDEAWLEDLLAEHWAPVWFHEFAADLARHGLAYVGESRLLEPATRVQRPGAGDRLAQAAGGDRTVHEQLRDLADGRHFREAVVCRADAAAALRARPDPAALRRLRFSALDAPERPLPPHAVHEPEIARVRERVLAARPAFPGFDALGAPEAVVLEALAFAQLTAHVEAPPATAAGERPLASPLVRAQARRGRAVTTLTGAVLVPDALGLVLLALLDGTRDRAALAAELGERAGVPVPAGALDRALEALGRLAVLVA